MPGMCSTVLVVGGCLVSGRKPVTESFVRWPADMSRLGHDCCAAPTAANRMHEAVCGPATTQQQHATGKGEGAGEATPTEVDFLITSPTWHLRQRSRHHLHNKLHALPGLPCCIEHTKIN